MDLLEMPNVETRPLLIYKFLNRRFSRFPRLTLYSYQTSSLYSEDWHIRSVLFCNRVLPSPVIITPVLLSNFNLSG